MTENRLPNAETWVDEYGDYLYKYALLRLRDPVLAEDVVQETFLSTFRCKVSGSTQTNNKAGEAGWIEDLVGGKVLRLTYSKQEKTAKAELFGRERENTPTAEAVYATE